LRYKQLHHIQKNIYIFKISVKTTTIVYLKNKQRNKQTNKKTDKNGVERGKEKKMIEIMKTIRFKLSIDLWERNTLKHKQKRARYTHNCKKEVGVAYICIK